MIKNQKTDRTEIRIEVSSPYNRSPEYWDGWALSYYQWRTGLSYKQIISYISIGEIVDMYHPYHEMDIRQFCDRINELYHARNAVGK